MALLTMTLAHRGLASRSMGAAALWSAAIRAWRNERMARRNVRELSGLGDRMLKDIGLHRSEVESVVRGPDPTRLVR